MSSAAAVRQRPPRGPSMRGNSRSRMEVPGSEQPPVPSTSLLVAVRVRPLSKGEIGLGSKSIVNAVDDHMVIIMDPDESKDYLDLVQNRTKEKKYKFDVAFGAETPTRTVFDRTCSSIAAGVLDGVNGTVFAYGATGSGKTYTMVGHQDDPGLMVLSIKELFERARDHYRDDDVTISCSYLEVYNEVIYDLLVEGSAQLELREDPSIGIVVAGLTRTQVNSPAEVLRALQDGNLRRKTEPTDANAESSRSHAVLEVSITRRTRNAYLQRETRGKLCLVDLAGSERAHETKNEGKKLRDGANINKSLLALANCINALGKKGSHVYIPYRNSKLTRLLKDSLGGNSRTVMVATVSSASSQYLHSVNTLKYADRAKEIKTHAVQNIGTVEQHVTEYQNIIDRLQAELREARQKLAARHTNSLHRSMALGDDMLAWLEETTQAIADNVDARINLQKALLEIEEMNLHNQAELSHVREALARPGLAPSSRRELESEERDLEEAIRENAEEQRGYVEELADNERENRGISERLDNALNQPGGQAHGGFYNILSSFRVQALQLQEARFQVAARDQIISQQRSTIQALWQILAAAGIGQDDAVELARQQGVAVRAPDVLRGSQHTSAPSAAESALSDGAARARAAGPDAEQRAAAAVGIRALGGGAAAAGRAMGMDLNASLMGNRANLMYELMKRQEASAGADGAATARDGDASDGQGRGRRVQSARRASAAPRCAGRQARGRAAPLRRPGCGRSVGPPRAAGGPLGARGQPRVGAVGDLARRGQRQRGPATLVAGVAAAGVAAAAPAQQLRGARGRDAADAAAAHRREPCARATTHCWEWGHAGHAADGARAARGRRERDARVAPAGRRAGPAPVGAAAEAPAVVQRAPAAAPVVVQVVPVPERAAAGGAGGPAVVAPEPAGRRQRRRGGGPAADSGREGQGGCSAAAAGGGVGDGPPGDGRGRGRRAGAERAAAGGRQERTAPQRAGRSQPEAAGGAAERGGELERRRRLGRARALRRVRPGDWASFRHNGGCLSTRACAGR
ncbi:unnamed protein product [Pedinophyceae sp. YPF-701]|nr:unnamed protein product [Pedinophyceae sp. YPF-701]